MIEDRSPADSVHAWFDRTYLSRGHRYLRPPHAYRIFLELLAPRKRETLLDVACGPAHLLHEAGAYGLVTTGIDFSTVALEMGRRLTPDADLHRADAAALPFPNDTFDYVTCIGALERMPDLARALSEQVRVAKSSARFCFLVRNARTLTWQLLMEGLGLKNKSGHQGAATLSEWILRFERAGFTVQRVVADQWPLMWRERCLRRLGLAPTFTRERRGWLPLTYAREFIFILSHD